MKNSNVIDLDKRRKTFKKEKNTSDFKALEPVTDITEMRQQMISEERREVKRTILTEFVGASVVLPGRGLQRVSLFDISDNGLAFDMEEASGQFKPGETIAMRVYLNHKTYFPFFVTVQHVKFEEDEAVFRHGTQFEKETVNREALGHFVKFIGTVSASLKSDQGDVMVSKIK